MKIFGSRQLMGKTVVSQDGTTVGEIHGLDVDVETWKVRTVEVKLERSVLTKLNLKKPVFGTHSVHLAIERISGVDDEVVLRHSLAEIAFVDNPESMKEIEAAKAENSD